MSDKRVRKYLQAGTMECMLLCMGVALVIGIGFISIGFWKTLLLAALLVLGLFIGGVSNKREVLSDWYNRLFPARAKQEATRRQLAEQVRRTVSNQDFDRDDEAVKEEDAGEFLDDLGEKAEEAVQEVREAAQEQIEEVKAGAEEIADKAQDAADALKDQAEAAADKAVDFAEETADKAAEAVSSFAEEAKDAAGNAIGDLGEAAKDALDSVKPED